LTTDDLEMKPEYWRRERNNV